MSVSFFELIARVTAGAVDQYSIEYKRRQELIRLQKKRRRRRIIISIVVVVILVIIGILLYKYLR